MMNIVKKIYKELKERFENFGIEEYQRVLDLLEVVLRMGAIKFYVEDTRLEILSDSNFEKICEILEISKEKLSDSLLKGKLKIIGENLETNNTSDFFTNLGFRVSNYVAHKQSK